ncbi:sigma-54 dependent transcriptional regulator [Breoghania sp. L-A4]|uniref:sigma-54-dependent transcriptional regulator n=1 Tax=Breoghania sp. L-A4 TaxID=2304600 RepID=UPI000E35D27B|nr:sigma-54 dependent transcriptional regulator [Breoghania sp. L-A4]AXS40221.1 sigma-54-dependent Fis family transcriptional regulator [Breoghania sp. L-A4]
MASEPAASKARVLLVEDTLSLATLYGASLTQAGLPVDHVATGKEALEHLETGAYQVVLLDLQLPDINGFEVMRSLRERGIDVTTVVVTGQGSVVTAVEAMRRGAYDFLVKPVAAERMITTVRNAQERAMLQRTVEDLSPEIGTAGFFGFIGRSMIMRSVYRMIESVSKSRATVFITGESGTGKEVCADAIHRGGPRRDKPFIAINCAAIPRDLIESEVFGHIKGSFTGAIADRDGAAALADGGTLFLDEICEMDTALQSKLLRFLQTGRIQPVGSSEHKTVDVRVICATNRDPAQEVAAGRFREDLFYRLHVLPIHLPPLRERSGDVIDIATHFLHVYAREERKAFMSLSTEAQELLMSQPWPGNVRELQNVVRNAVVLNDGEVVTSAMLSLSGPNGDAAAGGAAGRTGSLCRPLTCPPMSTAPFPRPIVRPPRTADLRSRCPWACRCRRWNAP